MALVTQPHHNIKWKFKKGAREKGPNVTTCQRIAGALWVAWSLVDNGRWRGLSFSLAADLGHNEMHPSPVGWPVSLRANPVGRDSAGAAD